MSDKGGPGFVAGAVTMLLVLVVLAVGINGAQYVVSTGVGDSLAAAGEWLSEDRFSAADILTVFPLLFFLWFIQWAVRGGVPPWW